MIEIDPYCLNDKFAAHNNMTVTRIAPNYAEAQMVVSKQHLNSLGIPHGGVYFTLADLAFGAANNYTSCNMVTLNSSTEYIASAKEGDTLTAYCSEVASSKKIRRYCTEIRNQDGKLLTVVQCAGYIKD